MNLISKEIKKKKTHGIPELSGTVVIEMDWNSLCFLEQRMCDSLHLIDETAYDKIQAVHCIDNIRRIQDEVRRSFYA